MPFAIVFVVSIGLAAWLTVANGTARGVPGTDIQLTAGEIHGRQLFSTTCGNCHTLAAARAVGKIGPDFDQLAGSGRIPQSLVAYTIAHGRSGAAGNMPAGLYSGPDAADIAAYVSRVAGSSHGPAGP